MSDIPQDETVVVDPAALKDLNDQLEALAVQAGQIIDQAHDDYLVAKEEFGEIGNSVGSAVKEIDQLQSGLDAADKEAEDELDKIMLHTAGDLGENTEED